jgi:hypothetical protein
MLTTSEFTEAIETELRFVGIAFDRAELLAWTEAMRPHIAEDPDAGRWAREFIEARATAKAP